MARLEEASMFSIQRKPLFVGISIGIALSLILVPPVSDRPHSCQRRPATADDDVATSPLVDSDRTEAYDPVIRVQHLRRRHHQDSLNNRPPMVRPRYYSTELGIRDKLLVAVLSTPNTLPTLGAALNATLHAHVGKLVFFVSGKAPVASPSLVAFPEESPAVPLPFLALRHVATHFLEDYDFFFFARDSTHVRGDRLTEFVSHISITYDVHVGSRRDPEERHCHLSAGILVSNSVLRRMANQIDWCIGEMALEDQDEDDSFGRCLLRSAGSPCAEDVDGKPYTSVVIPSDASFPDDLRMLDDVSSVLSVHPVSRSQGHHQLHLEFSRLELQQTRAKHQRLEGELAQFGSKVPSSRDLNAWPLGVDPPFKPSVAFDVIPWTFFDSSHHQFLRDEMSVVTEAKGVHRQALDHVWDSCMQWIREHWSTPTRLVNGYQRLDPTRGMEYILDVEFETGDVRRFEVVRPVGRVELMPVPYVTEHTRIVLVLPVVRSDQEAALEFLQSYARTCLEKQDNTILLMVLFYGPSDPGKGQPNDAFDPVKKSAVAFTTKFHTAGAKIAWIGVRTPKEDRVPSDFATLDLAIRKLSPDALVLLVRTGMQLRTEFLNRVRMNTVNRVQAFFPIPFIQYHPAVLGVQGIRPDTIETKRDHGHYDPDRFDIASFYAFDYLSARKAVAREVPEVHTDEDLHDERLYSAASGLYATFVHAGVVHVMRAVEPELRMRFRWEDCGAKPDLEAQEACRRSLVRNLGSKSHLARLVSKYEEDETT